MPEHNAAESRSHISAWAIVSSPMTLSFDLSDDAKLNAVWPVISNKEVIEISQTWVANESQPSGRLLKQWQAQNVPTLVAPSCKCLPSGTNRNHECVARNCSVCSPGNLSDDGIRGANQSWPGMENLHGWQYDPTTKTVSIATHKPGSVKGDDNSRLCIDVRGQLPGGLNYQHVLPCKTGSSTQRWHFDSTSGQLKSLNRSTQCLQGAQWYVD
jgi:hypothetical protein